MRNMLVLATALVLAAAAPVPTASASETPIVGDGGGGEFRLDCSPSQYVAGLVGRAGAWIDQVALLCAPVSADGRRGAITPSLGYGGQGGSPASGICAGDGVGKGLFVVQVAGGDHPRYVDNIKISCATQPPSDACFSAGGCGVSYVHDVPYHSMDCPPGELATGIRGRASNYLNAIGLVCGPGPTPPGPAPSTTSQLWPDMISLQSINFSGRFIRHRNFSVELTDIKNEQDRIDAAFNVRPALDGTPGGSSFEAIHLPGHFLRHKDFKILLERYDGSELFRKDASFTGLDRRMARAPMNQWQLQSTNLGDHYIRHSNFQLILSKNDGSEQFKQDSSFSILPAPGLTATAPAGALSFEAANVPGQYMRHRNNEGFISPVGSDLDRLDSNFVVRPGINGNRAAVSFESVNYPGTFLRHQNFRLKLMPNDGSQQFRDDASFVMGPCDPGSYCRTSFEAANIPGHYIRHRNFELWLSPLDGAMGGDHWWQIQPPR